MQHFRPRDDATNSCRLALLAGGFQVVDPLTIASADLEDRLHRKRCRASGINTLDAEGRVQRHAVIGVAAQVAADGSGCCLLLSLPLHPLHPRRFFCNRQSHPLHPLRGQPTA